MRDKGKFDRLPGKGRQSSFRRAICRRKKQSAISGGSRCCEGTPQGYGCQTRAADHAK
jgi:hypothetical protein